MKSKLALLWLFMTPLCLFAQNLMPDSVFYVAYDSTDYDFSRKWSKLYYELDLSQATTGYFIDRAVNFVDPKAHKGLSISGENSDDDTHYENICSIHQSFKLASLGDTSALFDSTAQMRATANQHIDNGTIPIVVFHMLYNTLSITAFDDSLVYFNGSDSTIRLGPDTSSSPFATDSTFLAALWADELEPDSVSFILPQDLIVKNTNRQVTNFTLKFITADETVVLNGDLNEIVRTDFSAFEDKVVDIEIWVYFDDGATFKSRGGIRFGKKRIPPTLYTQIHEVWNIAPTANHSGAKVTVALGCGKTKLTKPLIIVEGFDPLILSNKSNFNSLRDMFRNNITASEMLQSFEAQGYDLVYIDHNNGGDFLERNTTLFLEILNRVNTEKHTNNSTEKNAVLGISMGGVIGRYGLRLIELANQDHETDLYISLDAPHRGAYVPVAVQCMLKTLETLDKHENITVKTSWYLPDIEIDEKPFDMPAQGRVAIEVASCPAALQMLAYNIFDPNGYATLHRTFYNIYNNIGDLQNCREVALTNGSIVQKPQQLNDVNGYADMPNNALLASLSNTVAFLDVHFELRGLPDNNPMALIYKGKVKAKADLAFYGTYTATLTDWEFRGRV